MCKWEGNSMESEPSPQSFGTESGFCNCQRQVVEPLSWHFWHCDDGTGRDSCFSSATNWWDHDRWHGILGFAGHKELGSGWGREESWSRLSSWAVWGSKIRFRKVKRFWKILDFFTLPLWCSPVFLRDLKEQEIADPRFRRQYNSKCGQCGHVPGGSLDETTHQKNYDNSLQVKISLWKHVKWWMFFHVFPSSSWQETYWLAADFSRGNKKTSFPSRIAWVPLDLFDANSLTQI